MTNISIFASGSGSNAENIINFFEDSNEITIRNIISNKSDAYVHERAKKAGIESKTFLKSDFVNSEKIIDYLETENIDFIVLAGFLLKIPENIIKSYTNRIINIHPALLPKYGGKGMYGDSVHKAVVANRESESGITIHHVNSNYDEGNIIFQAKCIVEPRDTYQDVANKVHKLEYEFFPFVIEKVIKNL